MPSRTGSVQARAPGRAVDRDDAVRALAGAAQQAAAAVVLEAARERALAGGVERRADRVALVGLDRLAVEGEADHLLAVDALAGLVRAAGSRGGPLARGLRGHRGQQHLVGPRVALGEEPRAAPGAVVPPLALDAGDVAAEVVVLARALGSVGRAVGRGEISPP